MSEVPAKAPVAGTAHPRRWLILTVLLFSVLVVVLDNSILNVAIKTIAQPAPVGLGAGQSRLEWAINAYTLVFAGLLFTAGLLGDRLGRKKIMLSGMFVFGAGSVLSAFAGSSGQLIAFRAVMGCGAALVLPCTLAIIMNVFEREEQPKAIGVWTGAVGFAVALGPIVGGLLLQHFWWGSVFLVNVPIVVIALVTMSLLVPDSRDPDPGRLDPLGVLLSMAGLVLLVYGIIKGGQLADFTAPRSFGPAAAGVLVLAAFVLHERRCDHPAFDMRYFADRRFATSVAAIGLAFFALLGVTFFFVFYTQSVRGYTPLQSGLLLLPLAVSQMIFAPRARLVVRRFGPRVVCTSGLLLVAVAFSGFLVLEQRTSLWVLEVLFFVMGTAMAHVMPPATVMIMSSLPRERAGSASAVTNTFRQVGGAMGVAVLGSLLSAVYRDRVSDRLAAVPGLSEQVRRGAGESIEATLAAAARMGPAGRALVQPANDAFIQAMHTCAAAATIVCALGATIAAIFLPDRAALHRPSAEPEAAPAGSGQ